MIQDPFMTDPFSMTMVGVVMFPVWTAVPFRTT